MNGIGINVILGIVIFIFLVLNIYVRFRRARKTPLGRVASILAEAKHNEQLVEKFGFHREVGKLKTGAWQKSKGKVDFLPQELRKTLTRVFEMSEEVNERIDAARKFKSDSYMAGVDVSKLKAPLATSKQQLAEWLKKNIQNPQYYPKRRGLFG